METNYGCWRFSEKRFVTSTKGEIALDYEAALILALLSSENDEERGEANYAVIAMDEDQRPIWHEMVWHGAWQGYEWLYEHCVNEGEDAVPSLRK